MILTEGKYIYLQRVFPLHLAPRLSSSNANRKARPSEVGARLRSSSRFGLERRYNGRTRALSRKTFSVESELQYSNGRLQGDFLAISYFGQKSGYKVISCHLRSFFSIFPRFLDTFTKPTCTSHQKDTPNQAPCPQKNNEIRMHQKNLPLPSFCSWATETGSG